MGYYFDIRESSCYSLVIAFGYLRLYIFLIYSSNNLQNYLQDNNFL